MKRRRTIKSCTKIGYHFNFSHSLSYFLFAFVLLSSIFQLYLVKIGGSNFSLSALCALLLFPFEIKNVRLLFWKPLFFLILLMLIQIFSFAWSSDFKLGLRSLMGFLIFVIVTLAAFNIGSRYPKKLRNLFLIYFFLLQIPVFFVILFRLDQNLEIAFLHSSFAKILINPNIVDGLFHGTRNNIFDPTKAGGFFTNANVAAAFLGINALISYGFSKAYAISWLKAITLLLILGVFFTGSKAGVLLTILLFALLIITPKIIDRQLTVQRVLIALFFLNVILALALMAMVTLHYSDFVRQSAETIGVRITIWSYGFREFLHHPLMGLGFGGWQRGFAAYAAQIDINPNFPPHNTLIYLWAESGLVTVILALVFMFTILKFSIQLIKSRITDLTMLGIALLGAYSWTFIHGMGTNFGLVGELHMEIVLAALLGYSLSRCKSYSARYVNVQKQYHHF